MVHMGHRSIKEILTNIPLFAGGIFMVYIAAADETLFNAILGGNFDDRLAVALATTVAAALPMFFAVGLIKQSVVKGLYTIYYYERMLQGSIFWVLTIILLIAITAIILVQGTVHLYNAPIVAGCSLLSVYLVIYVAKLHKKQYP